MRISIADCVLALSILSFDLFLGCAHAGSPSRSQASTMNDPYLWLEEVEGPAALNFAATENKSSVTRLQGHAWYAEMEKDLRDILLATDRIPMPSFRGQLIYNFWQDEQYVRGLWRRTTVQSYRSSSTTSSATSSATWETVLDIDALAREEKANWVFKGSSCLPKEIAERCLVYLSNGGKDAVEVREFDLNQKRFVDNGFRIPEAKSSVTWISLDQVIVGTDWGPGSLTESGYPRILKVLTRGQNLADAKQIFEAGVKDLSAGASAQITPRSTQIILERNPSFFESEMFEWDPSANSVMKVPAPTDADFKGYYDGGLLIQMRSDWNHKGQIFRAGDLAHFQMPSRRNNAPPRKVFSKPAAGMIESVAVAHNKVIVVTLENVVNKVYEISKNMLGYRARRLQMPSTGMVDIVFADDNTKDVALTFENFLTPPSLYFRTAGGSSNLGAVVRTLPKKFPSDGFEVAQFFATSKDGTKIPYFHVGAKGRPLSKKTPTLLYGYGGFEIPVTPSYLSTVGKVWLGRGGSYVLANIRGGGEFGPSWHQAALKSQRHKAFEDFIAVAEDLIARGLTSADHLGIQGGSNGGLLVSTVAVMRPDLFRAVLCEVPLIDMLRYHLLLAGASWVGEYGSPEDPEMAAYIRTYSPYQNLKPGVKYPEMFVTTSTKDDRVHPGHARKFVARLKDLGQPVLYYENVNGGHAGAANLAERVKMRSLAFSYLWEKLSTRR